MKLKYTSILSSAFMLLLLLIVLNEVLGVRAMNSISNLTTELYDHPFTVSNSVLQINLNIAQIHRDMKDVILSSTPEELEQTVLLVDAREAEVLNLFTVVKERFLGDSKRIEEAELLFIGWKPIRDSVINLKLDGRDIEAASITRNEGAAYIENMTTIMDGLSEFANERALEFVQMSLQERTQTRSYLNYILLASLFLGSAIALFAARRLAASAKSLRRYADERNVYAENVKDNLVDSLHAVSLMAEKRDPYTSGHMSRVAELSVAIGHKLGFSDHEIVGIELGASIHDIGKIHIPAEILNRPGKLSNAEFELIKTHPNVGYDIIKDIDYPWPIAGMVLSHHERIDGSGYPDGLKGDEIPYGAQLIAVADVVEAVSSHRPYRESLGIDVGLKIIKEGRGSLYNPEIVDVCVDLFEKEGFEFSSKF